MIKILLVENDEDKWEELSKFLETCLTCEIVIAKSFQSGLKQIKEAVFDLLVLDMSIPTFDIGPSESGGRDQPFGGELLMYELLRREISTKSVVVTQFDLFGKGDDATTLKDLDLRLRNVFGNNYLGIVQYSITHSGWKDILLSKINHLN